MWSALDRTVVGRKQSFLMILWAFEVLVLIAESNSAGIRREMAMMPLIRGLGIIIEEGGLAHSL